MKPPRFSAWITEGGIRCPLLARFPPLGATGGKITHAFTTVQDILPTFLELAGVRHPTEIDPNSKLHKMKGKSWVSLLSGKSDRVHADDAVHGWELFGQCALRTKNWKAVFVPPPRGNGKWMLFDIEKDPGETKNVAQEHPAVLEEMVRQFDHYGNQVGLVTRQKDYRQAAKM